MEVMERTENSEVMERMERTEKGVWPVSRTQVELSEMRMSACQVSSNQFDVSFVKMPCDWK